LNGICADQSFNHIPVEHRLNGQRRDQSVLPTTQAIANLRSEIAEPKEKKNAYHDGPDSMVI
jgi:hypothetical protein